MSMNPKMSLVSFLAVLAALEIAPSAAQALQSPTSPVMATEQSAAPLQIEARLSRLTQTLQNRVTTLPETSNLGEDVMNVAVWVNSRGGGGFANVPGGGGFINNRGGGGFANVRPGGGFLNSRPWRNGWADGGGFLNRR